MIPANAREGARELEAADDDIDAVAVERRVNHLAQQLCAGGRVLRRLDHHAVAGGEHLDQRTDRQVEREVPRHDVADRRPSAAAARRHARTRTAPGRRRGARSPSSRRAVRPRTPRARRDRALRSGRRPSAGARRSRCSAPPGSASRWLDQHPGERAEQSLALLQRRETGRPGRRRAGARPSPAARRSRRRRSWSRYGSRWSPSSSPLARWGFHTTPVCHAVASASVSTTAVPAAPLARALAGGDLAPRGRRGHLRQLWTRSTCSRSATTANHRPRFGTPCVERGTWGSTFPRSTAVAAWG